MKPTAFLYLITFLAAPSHAQLTQRVNVSYGGGPAGGQVMVSQSGRCVSADGRFVLFASGGGNIVPGDTNAASDIFVRDRLLETNERVSVDSTGVQANGNSGDQGYTMTPDARFVAFHSTANNLVPGDTNGAADVFLRDRLLGTTERISLGTGGVQGNGSSHYPSISVDGRFVAFASEASNLFAGDSNAEFDVFVRDRVQGTTLLVSGAMTGSAANDYSYQPSMSDDGRFIAFYSVASNLVPGDTNGRMDVFVHDCLLGSTIRVSVSSMGLQGNFDSGAARMSGDGRFVLFTSYASTLVGGDTNGNWDVFVHDMRAGTTSRVSVSASGVQANGSSYPGSLSVDGRYVAFPCSATNLVPGVSYGGIYLKDRATGTVEFLTPGWNGAAPNSLCQYPSLSRTCRYLVFTSIASNLVPGDTNLVEDVFLRDRFASGFTSLCSPGADGVLACPCNNKAASPERGCDNSSATGGAKLDASGIAYLSQDELVFTTSDECPSATSVLVQGSTLISGGVLFGQGVRCAGGSLRRLFVKSAVGGGITAPELGSADPSISARSAALGTPLQPGVPYVYFVAYRDPIVLGNCPATSTINATQSGVVSWWP